MYLRHGAEGWQVERRHLPVEVEQGVMVDLGLDAGERVLHRAQHVLEAAAGDLSLGAEAAQGGLHILQCLVYTLHPEV